jgi:nucleoid DNA-binding protein
LWDAGLIPYTSRTTSALRLEIAVQRRQANSETAALRTTAVSGKKIIEPPGDRPGLTKADLVDVVYERHGGLTRYEAAEIVEAILKTVKTSLRDGRTVRIKNFGTFEVTTRPGRMGVNPVNGEKIFIPPHKGLSFRPARRLRDVIRPGRFEDD